MKQLLPFLKIIASIIAGALIIAIVVLPIPIWVTGGSLWWLTPYGIIFLYLFYRIGEDIIDNIF